MGEVLRCKSQVIIIFGGVILGVGCIEVVTIVILFHNQRSGLKNTRKVRG